MEASDLLLDQRRERLGGDFLEVPECERAFALGEGSGDLDGISGFDGDDGGKVAIPFFEGRERSGGVGVERGQAAEDQPFAIELRERLGDVDVKCGQAAEVQHSALELRERLRRPSIVPE